MRSRPVCYSIALPVALFVMLISCVRQRAGWGGRIAEEDGVTVVYNPLTPSNLGRVIALRELYAIEEADESLAAQGLTRIRDFAVDSRGNLFLLTQFTERDYILKLDHEGGFVSSFGRKGQGQ